MKKSIHQAPQKSALSIGPDKESSGYTVTIPSLPGCISEGDDFEEALKNIKEAASLYLEVMRKRREVIIKEEKGVIVAPVQVKV